MRKIISFIVCCSFLILLASESCAQDRGVKVITVGGDDLEIGTYYLLAIAIDKYRDQDLELKTAVAGAQELQSVLVKNYTFDKKNCTLLLDAEATRDGIIESLRQLAENVREEDSVLIYYAGHGNLDKLTTSGSWIPWEATLETPAQWIGNEEIKQLINAMKARHVLLISDSCFSGDLFRSQRQTVPQIDDANIRRAFNKKSRHVMTAGGLEPVADGGRNGHSIYTWSLLNALSDVAPYIVPEDIHDYVKKAVSLNAHQKPMYGLLHGVGGEPDGSFVFFRKGTVSLDDALQKKMKRIAELEKLDKEGAEKSRRQQEEISTKQEQLAMLDKRLSELQAKTGKTEGQHDLDAMIAMLEEKEQKALELEILRLKAEAELESKEKAIAEEREKLFQEDYEKYKKITLSEFASNEVKSEAWTILCQKWNLSSDIKMGVPLIIINNEISHINIVTIPGAVFQMVSIPGGTFQMGDSQYKGKDNKAPVHTVTLSPFEMCTTEITQAQYESVMGKNPSHFKGKNLPVENVSWNDAMKFCKKLSRITKKEYTLPTEAEWEYACRAGTKTNYSIGNKEFDLNEVGWHSKNSGEKTHPVGQKISNGWGFYDMHGNVFEWCSDFYDEDYYNISPGTDPTGPKKGSQRVVRGGSWEWGTWGAAHRFKSYRALGGSDTGFRIVRRP